MITNKHEPGCIIWLYSFEHGSGRWPAKSELNIMMFLQLVHTSHARSVRALTDVRRSNGQKLENAVAASDFYVEP